MLYAYYIYRYYLYIYTHVLVLIESWPFFGLLQGGVATQCIQLELVDLKRRPSGLQHAGVPESRCSGNDRSLEFWCLGEAVFYILLYSIHIYCIHREREREREKEINFIQLDLFPQGLVIALILWCIYCATSAEIQVPEGTPAVVFTLPSTLPTWHQNHLWHRLREFDTWTCAGCQCWRRPKLVLALSLLLDRWAFVIFFSLYNIRTFFCNPLNSLNTHHMFLELPVLQHVSTNIV